MDETVETAAPMLKQYYGKSKMHKSKMSKETKDKVSNKIKYLMDKEGKPQDQAIAMAYAMEAPKYAKAKKKK